MMTLLRFPVEVFRIWRNCRNFERDWTLRDLQWKWMHPTQPIGCYRMPFKRILRMAWWKASQKH
jgi:hypothetical protein